MEYPTKEDDADRSHHQLHTLKSLCDKDVNGSTPVARAPHCRVAQAPHCREARRSLRVPTSNRSPRLRQVFDNNNFVLRVQQVTTCLICVCFLV